MGEYFKPLRRKLGVVTLLMACVLMAGWVRSLSIFDAVTFPFTGTIAESLSSNRGNLYWDRTESTEYSLFPSTKFKWHSEPTPSPENFSDSFTQWK